MNIEEAKKVLREAGYYVDNLWSVEDVRMNEEWVFGENYSTNLTDEQCYKILDSVMHNEGLIPEIHSLIANELE